MIIPNKYNNTLDNFINSSETESQNQLDSVDWPILIDKGLRNASRSRSHLLTLL